MNNKIDTNEIKSRYKISDVISNRIKITKNGSNRFKALCPFHNEKTPSFHIDDHRGVYKCFGCGETGDMFNFIQKHDNIKDFPKTMEILSSMLGFEIEINQKDYSKVQEKNKTFDINRFAMEYFAQNLEEAPDVVKYFVKRGISLAKIKDFGLGYAKDSYNSITTECKNSGFSEYDIVNSGFAKKSDNGSIYTIFRNRAIVSIFDILGKCIGFGGRALDPKEDVKYINSFESKVFKKGQTLYNINRAVKKKSETAIVCEGYMDAISLDIAGFASLAPLGTAITLDQILLVKKYFKRAVFWMDSDKAGVESTLKAARLMYDVIDENFEALFVHGISEKDPDEYIKKNGKASVGLVIDRALKLHDFVWKNLSQGVDFKNPNHLAKLNQDIKACLVLVKNENIRSEYGFFFRNKIYEAKFGKSRNISIKAIPTLEKQNLLDRDILQLAIIHFIIQKNDLLEGDLIDVDLDENYNDILSQAMSGDIDFYELLKSSKLEFDKFSGDEIDQEFLKTCMRFQVLKLKESMNDGFDIAKMKYIKSEIEAIQKKLSGF